jgi:hypothetical protein
MPIPRVPFGMGYIDFSKRVSRPFIVNKLAKKFLRIDKISRLLLIDQIEGL